MLNSKCHKNVKMGHESVVTTEPPNRVWRQLSTITAERLVDDDEIQGQAQILRRMLYLFGDSQGAITHGEDRRDGREGPKPLLLMWKWLVQALCGINAFVPLDIVAVAVNSTSIKL
jgi:hypothetical protein